MAGVGFDRDVWIKRVFDRDAWIKRVFAHVLHNSGDDVLRTYVRDDAVDYSNEPLTPGRVWSILSHHGTPEFGSDAIALAESMPDDPRFLIPHLADALQERGVYLQEPGTRESGPSGYRLAWTDKLSLACAGEHRLLVI